MKIIFLHISLFLILLFVSCGIVVNDSQSNSGSVLTSVTYIKVIDENYEHRICIPKIDMSGEKIQKFNDKILKNHRYIFGEYTGIIEAIIIILLTMVCANGIKRLDQRRN